MCMGLGNSPLPDPLRIVLIPYGGKELVASDQDELGPFRDGTKVFLSKNNLFVSKNKKLRFPHG